MAKARKKKQSKASREAAASLHGRATRPEPIVKMTLAKKGGKIAWLDRPIGPGLRITWRAIVLFLLGCAVLDALLYLIFRLGFSSCYAVSCLFE